MTIPLDDRIDALYALPLAQFTAARNGLAKSLTSADRDRVKSLAKPTTVAWAVNLLYWRERKTYDRLLRCGQSLRAAQVAALEGRSADIRAAAAKHRDALADAVSCARQVAAGAGATADADALSRMLEALSVSADEPSRPGRWTEATAPAGLEALAGITPTTRTATAAGSAAPARSEGAAGKRRNEAEAARRTAAEAVVRAAGEDVDRAAAAELDEDARVEAARQQLARAEAARDAARERTARARKALDAAKAALAKL